MLPMPRHAARTEAGSSGFQGTISASGSLPNSFSSDARDRPTTRYGVPAARNASATLLPMAPAAPNNAILSVLMPRFFHKYESPAHRSASEGPGGAFPETPASGTGERRGVAHRRAQGTERVGVGARGSGAGVGDGDGPSLVRQAADVDPELVVE